MPETTQPELKPERGHRFKATHGVKSWSAAPEDCVSRECKVLFDAERELFYIRFKTVWSEDETPHESEVTLTRDALELLEKAVAALDRAPNDYAYKTKEPQDD